MNIFDRKFWIDLKSDFTIHSLKRYAEKLKEGKCLSTNDGTTLLASKAKRAKDRLTGGLSELLADGKYTYQDFRTMFSLEGKVTLIMNITSESYQNYKDRLLGLTFSERLLTVHHTLTKIEKEEWVAKEERAKKLRFNDCITVDDIETNVRLQPKYFKLIEHLAQEFSYLSLRSFIGCQDLIKATLLANASLNKRQQTCTDDFRFLMMIKDYLVNPFSPYEGRIVKYASQGFSVRDIAKKLDKPNYNRQVQRVVDKARLRGILELEQPIQHRRRIRK